MRLFFRKKGKADGTAMAILLFMFVAALSVANRDSSTDDTTTTGESDTAASDSTTDTDTDTDTDEFVDEDPTATPTEEVASCDTGTSGDGTILGPAYCVEDTPIWACVSEVVSDSTTTEQSLVYETDFPYDRDVQVGTPYGSDLGLLVTISEPEYYDDPDTTTVPVSYIDYDVVEYKYTNDEDFIVDEEYHYLDANDDDEGQSGELVRTLFYDNDGEDVTAQTVVVDGVESLRDGDAVEIENWDDSWTDAKIVQWELTVENTSTTEWYDIRPFDTTYISQINYQGSPVNVDLPVSLDAMSDLLVITGSGTQYWFANVVEEAIASAESFDENDSDSEDYSFEYDGYTAELDVTTATIIRTALSDLEGATGLAYYNEYIDNVVLTDFNGDAAELMYYIAPGTTRTFYLGAYIPEDPTGATSTTVIDITYETDSTLAREDILAGQETNPVTFNSTRNPDVDGCLTDSPPYSTSQLDDTSPAFAAALRSDYGGLQLERAPLQGPLIVVRGFGCSEVFTGVRSSTCPGDKPWFHNGIDYVAPYGTDYYDPLPSGSEVLYAGRWRSPYPNCSSLISSAFPHEGLGYYIKHWGLVNGIPVTIWGGHLSTFSVRTGQDLFEGQILGETGTSGCSSGPHLHFAVEVNGVFVNPALVLPQ